MGDDRAYYARRLQMIAAIADSGTTAAVLASRLSWSIHEVRGKLMTARKDGLVAYNNEWGGALWTATVKGRDAVEGRWV